MQCMSSPTNLCEKKPRSKTSGIKLAGSALVQVLSQAALEFSKPEIQSITKDQGAGGQGGTHVGKGVPEHDTLSKSSPGGVEASRKGGTGKML